MWCYVEKTETVEQQSKTTKEKEMIYYGKEKAALFIEKILMLHDW